MLDCVEQKFFRNAFWWNEASNDGFLFLCVSLVRVSIKSLACAHTHADGLCMWTLCSTGSWIKHSWNSRQGSIRIDVCRGMRFYQWAKCAIESNERWVTKWAPAESLLTIECFFVYVKNVLLAHNVRQIRLFYMWMGRAENKKYESHPLAGSYFAVDFHIFIAWVIIILIYANATI